MNLSGPVMSNRTISNRSFIIALLILVVSLAAIFFIATRGKPKVVSINLDKLPMQINGLQGNNDSFSDAVYKELNADKNIYRHYRSSDNRQVDLYIAYFGTAKGGRTGHAPVFCLPSQGWGVQESHEITLFSSYYPKGVKVNYLLSTKEDTVLTTIYWYQSEKTKVLSNGIKQNIQRFMGMVFRNRNDGAFVRITILSDKENTEIAKLFASSFSERILNLLPDYWPVEK